MAVKDIRAAEEVDQAMGQFGGGERLRLAELEHGELAVVEAGDDIAGARCRAQPVGGGPQHCLAQRLAERFGNLAQAVEADRQRRGRAGLTFGHRRQRRQSLLEQKSVAEAGHRIHASVRCRACVRGDAVRDILGGDEEVVRQRCRLNPQHAAVVERDFAGAPGGGLKGGA